MKVMIYGCDGNMGQRYQAILKSKKIPYVGLDRNDPWTIEEQECTHIILATPTPSHIPLLERVAHSANRKLKFLVEKPIGIIRDVSELDVLKEIENKGHKIYMVNNYAYVNPAVINTNGDNVSIYSYYNSGKDGLKWDCIQLIYLAEGKVLLYDTNPIWRCVINGVAVNRSEIDKTYVDMIMDFYSDNTYYGRLWGRKDIIAAHNKVLNYEKRLNSSSGKKHLHAVT